MNELINNNDVFLFHEGTNYEAYKLLGAHKMEFKDKIGVRFVVWAPNAKEIELVGDFNNWNGEEYKLKKYTDSNLWYIFIEGLEEGYLYKYKVLKCNNKWSFKSDPYAFYSEKRPNTASIIYSLDNYNWNDNNWMIKKNSTLKKPMSIYEVHLGSWDKKNYKGYKEDHGNFYTYDELSEYLVEYVHDMGYTHIELLPIMEHPLDDSWGYQSTGFFSPTSRHGEPIGLKKFIDKCHQKNIGVLLDWVPGHFCKDEHGLEYFDGKANYEYDDFEKANNKGWGTLNFNLEKKEVISFLISNAVYWIKEFHFDGFRVDAVANILYLNYGKEDGEWKRNKLGGNENLEAVSFIKKLNEVLYHYFPNIIIIAEESTTWPFITRPTYDRGLGFTYKWNMGWMNDTLSYMKLDPIFRKNNHHKLTFAMMYQYTENFILPLSHDEVVHGKKSLIDKMPGEYEEKFNNLRAYLGFMFGFPGKKLLFMGCDFAQFIEWNFNRPLDWFLLEYPKHREFKYFIKELLHFYKLHSSLWYYDHNSKGFQWINADDTDNSVYSFYRYSHLEKLIVVSNFTPVLREDYFIGVEEEGEYKIILNSDDKIFGGSGIKNKSLEAIKGKYKNYDYYIRVNLAPMSTIFIKKKKNKNSKGDGIYENRHCGNVACRGTRY